MTMVQYSFMAAIGYGNAAIATVLQYTGPIYIILWLIIRKYAKWTFADAFIILGIITGVVLLATNRILHPACPSAPVPSAPAPARRRFDAHRGDCDELHPSHLAV